jgi:hypothetical protein
MMDVEVLKELRGCGAGAGFVSSEPLIQIADGKLLQ